MTDLELDATLVAALVDEPQLDRVGLAHVAQLHEPLIDAVRLAATVDRVWRRARGLGFIEPFMADPAVTEIMVNGPDSVWIERLGLLQQVEVTSTTSDIELLVERILDPIGLRADRLNPLVDGRLSDGSRINVVMPPLVDSPVVTIRRFTVDDVALDAFAPPQVASLLAECVRRGDNIVVSGATGAGKTTLLNALGQHFGQSQRVVVIEDTTELALPGDHVVQLEARPANSEGVGLVTIRDLVRNALRMRPDRLVIGETRGAETFDLMMALNTGHRGTLVTCHANGPTTVLDRLTQLALLAGSGLSPDDIRYQLTEAIDVVVQVERRGSTRRVSDIVAVAPGGRLQTWWSDRSAEGLVQHRTPNAPRRLAPVPPTAESKPVAA